MYYSNAPEERAGFIAALRQLADYLAEHPAVPVPEHGADITLHANSTEDGGRDQVTHIARLLGATITDDTATGGHYRATREFGLISYEAVSIPTSCMDRHHAFSSYRGCVTPDI
jgi:hypothetical protein